MALVLLVSRNPDSREPYRMWLEHARYRVLEAAEPGSARPLVEAGTPEVSVLELFEPREEALATLAELSALVPASQPLIVLASWHPEENPLPRERRSWASWLVKPVSPVALEAEVRRYLAPAA